jgi:hypothetical protein
LGKDVADFISKLLVKDPRKRLGGGRRRCHRTEKTSFLQKFRLEQIISKGNTCSF